MTESHPHTLFVSDLHLSAQEPATSAQFLEFLRDTAPRAKALYILGDLFEYWAGDDDLDDALNRSVVDALAHLAAATPVFFIHGNRDFLVGERFATASATKLLPDPTLIELHGAPTLLMHGDLLCTDDVRYQAFRRQVRDPAWQTQFLAKPLAERKAIIDNLRKMSEQEKGDKRAEIMDVNLDSVAQTLRQHACPRLIHGHTHRPAQHAHHVDGRSCERWVLPDWYRGSGGYLHASDAGCRLVRFDA